MYGPISQTFSCVIICFFSDFKSHHPLSFSFPNKLIFICTHALLQDGWTPLHLAVQTKRTDIVRLLLIKGADRFLKNRVKFPNLCLMLGASPLVHSSVACLDFFSPLECSRMNRYIIECLHMGKVRIPRNFLQ